MKSLKIGFYSQEALKSFGFRKIGKNVSISKMINIVGSKNISLGDNVRLDSFCNIIAASGSLKIGNHCHIASNCFLLCTGGIELRDFCTIAPAVNIFSSSDNYDGSTLTNPMVTIKFSKPQPSKVTLGKHVIIGTGSVILPGCTIGEGSSVGALSLINRSLKPWEVYAGIPAKKIANRKKKLLEDEKVFLKEYKNENKN